MFNFSSSDRMEKLKDFRPTSKIQLRQFCICFTDGDVEKADKLYNYYASGIELPDTEPVPPSKMQVVKDNALDIFGFVRDNQTDIVNAIAFIKALFSRGGATTITQQVAEALPKIN